MQDIFLSQSFLAKNFANFCPFFLAKLFFSGAIWHYGTSQKANNFSGEN